MTFYFLKIALHFLLLAEKVSGYHFANIADLKAKMSEDGMIEKDEKIANLEEQISSKTIELEKVQNAISDAMDKTKAKDMKTILKKVNKHLKVVVLWFY